MTVVDDGRSRPDLAARREIKFLLTNHGVDAVRDVLLQTCRPIRYAGRVSTVRSLYFDDPSLRACRANLDGVGLRHKTRLRWYDAELPSDHAFVEIKWRRHNVCGKHRLRVECHKNPARFSFRQLHREMRLATAGSGAMELDQDDEAVVVVEYKREHFILDGPHAGDVRLTLDYDLRFYPQLGRRSWSRRWCERVPDVVLIECKTGVGRSRAAHRALAPLRVRPTRFSKYVVGCRRLGYVTDS